LLRSVPRRRRRPAPAAVARLGWIKLGAIGDLLLLTPALDALRAAHPRAEFWGIVSRGNAALARRLGLADHWLVIDPVAELGRPKRLHRRWRDLPPLDVALCFEQWSRGTAWLFTRLPAAWRAGYWTPGHLAGRGLDWCELHRRDRHEWQNFAALARAAGATVDTPALRLPLTAAEREWAAAQGFADAVVLHPGAGRAPRRLRGWSEERFVELGATLQSEGRRVIVTGAPDDAADAAGVARVLGAPFVTGELGQIAAGLAAAALVVVANTGVLHMAAAVGTPSVTPNGPVDLRRFGALGSSTAVPADYPCSPCLHLGFEYRCPAEPGACMHTIAVAAVHAACRTLLGGDRGHAAGAEDVRGD
jgi:ADP-heptose:LPS heptosyltransferase